MRHLTLAKLDKVAAKAELGTLTTMTGKGRADQRLFEVDDRRYLVDADGFAKRVQVSGGSFADANVGRLRTDGPAFLTLTAGFDLRVVA